MANTPGAAGLAVPLILGLAAAISAAEPAKTAEKDRLIAEIAAARAELAASDRALRLAQERLAVAAEGIPSGASADLAAARERLRAAEEAREAAARDGPLADLAKRLEAARAERDAKVEQVLAGARAYLDAKVSAAVAAGKVHLLTARLADLSDAEVRDLAAARLESDRLSKALAAARRAMWTTAAVAPLYERADALYKEHAAKTARDPKFAEATKGLAAARKALLEAQEKAAADHPRCKAAVADRAAQESQRDAARARLAAARTQLLGPQAWPYEVSVPLASRRGQERPPSKARLWVPPGCAFVRGIILGHPPAIAASLPASPIIRTAAAQEDLACVLLEELDGLFDYARNDSPQRLEKALADLAAKSGRPELAGAPFITVGHSTSGIFARNVATWRPDRAAGVVHIKSGNMHQHIPDAKATLAGVPFLAVNGEFEEFGPEGGIRPEYGGQTQWIMIREQVLRLRGRDPRCLMGLLVDPGGGHGNWNDALSDYVALFIRKAARCRIPKDRPAPGAAVRCLAVDPAAGWLTDADLKDPRHPPAAWAHYGGDRAKAFWHFDEEMAMTTYNYHKDAFLAPDLARDRPVPADWPPRGAAP
jgi:hypothetical protein